MATIGENFNSTMVRLKAVEAQSLQQAPVFQFHYGTIKRARGAISPTSSQ